MRVARELAALVGLLLLVGALVRSGVGRVVLPVLALALVAAGGLLVPPTAGAAVGLSVLEHLLLVGALEFASAVAIAALVLYYQRPEDDREESEWRFDP